ncbi:hypothetical protein DFP72DRAFT_1083663 [Ephemerocybe angulata]|uniref:Uncharacterized protein n=1 Tax=Ephemerocybe angulata TaxID=980116 RepID=A0A8H6H909_9AGAR|nr:hypothetical protein DFP72DRAFT_1083663 [Tulosesus angulatus]
MSDNDNTQRGIVSLTKALTISEGTAPDCPPTPEYAHAQLETPAWCDIDSPAFPLLKVKLCPYGAYYRPSDSGLMPCHVMEVLRRYDDTNWVAELRNHKSLINPAFARLDAVQGLETPWGVFYTIPRQACPQVPAESALSACFIMTGAVSESYLKAGYTSRHKSDSSFRTDKRISIWPFEDVYQRTFAYLAAVAHKSSISFKFSGGQITFVTGKRGNAIQDRQIRTHLGAPANAPSETTNRGILQALSSYRGPYPFHVGRGGNLDNIRHIQSFVFPIALRYESEVPVFNATNPQIRFTEWTWESVTTLPLWQGEVPQDALVTIGFTAIATPCGAKGGSLTLPVQFVVVHFAGK